MRSLNSIALNDLSKRHDIADLRVSAILKAGIRKRLELQTPVLVVWPEAMAMGAMPQNALGTARVIEELCDGLWGIAGRQGPDLTQKAALGVVYAATEVHMLADSSHEYRNTWEFLDKRIADMMALGSVPSELERILKSGIGTLLGSIRFGDQIVGTRSNLKDKQ
jgi:ubiquinone biosynthesis protein COQ9